MSVEFSVDNFNKKAFELINISKMVNDNWEINEKSSNFYLSKRDKISLKLKNVEEEVESEDKSVMQNDLEEIITIEYHVVFHPSYQVPALYFNAWHDNSKLIDFNDVANIFVDEYETNNSCREEIHNIISQAEHPLLFKPFFCIHPCKTHDVLSKFPESKNFILTFLSIFGPSVRLKMSDEYEKFYVGSSLNK